MFNSKSVLKYKHSINNQLLLLNFPFKAYSFVATETRNRAPCADSNVQSARSNLPGDLKHSKIPYELLLK